MALCLTIYFIFSKMNFSGREDKNGQMLSFWCSAHTTVIALCHVNWEMRVPRPGWESFFPCVPLYCPNSSCRAVTCLLVSKIMCERRGLERETWEMFGKTGQTYLVSSVWAKMWRQLTIVVESLPRTKKYHCDFLNHSTHLSNTTNHSPVKLTTDTACQAYGQGWCVYLWPNILL